MSENTASGCPPIDWPVGHYARDFAVALLVSGALVYVGIRVLLTTSLMMVIFHGNQGAGISGLTMALMAFCNWLAWNGLTLALCASLLLATLYAKWGPQPERRRRMVRIAFWSFLTLQIGVLLGLTLPVLGMEPVQ